MSTLHPNINCAVENGTATARFFAAEIGSGKVVPSLFLLVAARSAAFARGGLGAAIRGVLVGCVVGSFEIARMLRLCGGFGVYWGCVRDAWGVKEEQLRRGA